MGSEATRLAVDGYEGNPEQSQTAEAERRRVHWIAARADGDVLDVGSPDGMVAFLLAEAGFAVVGVNDDVERVRFAEERRSRLRPAAAERLDLRVAPVTELPFGDATFDTVVLEDVLASHARPDRVLAEALRILRKGGVLLLTSPVGEVSAAPSRVFPHSVARWVGTRAAFTEINLNGLSLQAALRHGTPDIPSANLVANATEKLFGEVLRNSSALQAELVEIARQSESAITDLDASKRELQSREREFASMRQALADRERDLQESKEELDEAVRALEKEKSARARSELGAGESRRRVEEERQRNRVYEQRLSVAQWKLDSIANRKVWRLNEALTAARKDRSQVRKLPGRVVRVLRTRSVPPRRPPRLVASPSAGSAGVRAVVRSTTRVAEPASRLLTPPPVQRLSDLRVASVLDTMSERCFGAEARLVTFRPDNWQQMLEDQSPHMLLVESAWRGGSGSWEYQIGSYSYGDSVGLPHLAALVEWCRSRGIPTIFWNKEDPVHFNKFKEAARLFDVVLTTDANMLDKYRGLGGAPQVFDALPFAAQPRLHNPIAAYDRSPAPVFAGTFYKNRHPERQRQLEMLLDGAMPFGLIIYDRMAGAESESFGFPERFRPAIRGSLPYEQMVAAYKRHRVFLNTNSVTESPTMFSRRVFELLASGTPVVSTPSAGMERLFGEVVEIVRSEEEARDALRKLGDAHYWGRVSRRGIRMVHPDHTYGHRLARIATIAGLDVEPPESHQVGVVLPLDAPSSLEKLVSMLQRQNVRAQEILIGDTNASVGARGLDALRDLAGSVRSIAQGDDQSRFERTRQLAKLARSPWVLVGDGLLELAEGDLDDLLACTSFAQADVITPAAGARDEHAYISNATGSVALVRSEVLAERGWPGESDSAEFSQWHAGGVRIYHGPIIQGIRG